MKDSRLQRAIDAVPAGRWGVAVSGGADSVALLSLLRGRAETWLHAIHLDHQTRGEASTADAAFVADLAARWSIPVTIATRAGIEPVLARRPANRSAFYRALRWALFRKTVAEQGLEGVLLAHHRNDQAETVFQRLLRSNSPAGVRGMAGDAVISEVRILRPLLDIPGEMLRHYLVGIGQGWREDASNRSAAYQRNRVRAVLRAYPEIIGPLVELGESSRELGDWLGRAGPVLGDRFAIRLIFDLPVPVAERALRDWLRRQGFDSDNLTADLLAGVRRMLMDAACAGRFQLPGRRLLRRRGGEAWVEPNP